MGAWAWVLGSRSAAPSSSTDPIHCAGVSAPKTRDGPRCGVRDVDAIYFFGPERGLTSRRYRNRLSFDRAHDALGRRPAGW